MVYGLAALDSSGRNMGASYSVSGLRYLPRQDGGSGAANGRIGQYEVYVSTDGTNWGTAVATGAFANDASQEGRPVRREDRAALATACRE